MERANSSPFSSHLVVSFRMEGVAHSRRALLLYTRALRLHSATPRSAQGEHYFGSL